MVRATDQDDGAVTLGGQFPALPQVGGGIEAVERDRLEAGIAAPDGGVAAVGVTGLHDLGERRVVPDRVEVGVLVHLPEIGVAVLDRLPSKLRARSASRRPFAWSSGRRPGGQGEGTGGVIAQVGILGLLLERRFQGLECLVGPLAQFRRHDDRQVELWTLGGVAPSGTSPVRPGRRPSCRAGRGRWPGTDWRGPDCGALLDHGLEVVEGLLILAQPEVRRRPSEPGIEIVGLRLEPSRRSQGRAWARSSAGRPRCRR